MHNPQGYKKLYITFYRLFDSEDVLRYRVDLEVPEGQETFLDAETHVVITSLNADDFFNPVLFHNVQAVNRFAKNVGRTVDTHAA